MVRRSHHLRKRGKHAGPEPDRPGAQTAGSGRGRVATESESKRISGGAGGS